MTESTQVVHRDLAAAVQRKVERTGQSTPAIRGSDWQTTTVTAVKADGTVDAGGIEDIRRMATYQAPAVGDWIVISQESSGNWVAHGRLVPATGDAWVTPTLTSPWISYPGGGNYQGARYKRMADGMVVIEGLIASNGVSVSGTSTVFTLPAGYRPTATLVLPTINTGNVIRQLEIVETGVVRFASLPAGVVGFISISCSFLAATT
ncbi:hypothetical protein OG342_06840 [Streptomyces bobili]|uniref:hypothetical protein n=1 Tax=Streptomyces bobili TaxID=67280 RepID=UPI00225703A2|nr:hypothetical protein [Streptomyces bobili]MCX5522579.1 hypothetical protein [Streptomyces bobili]